MAHAGERIREQRGRSDTAFAYAPLSLGGPAPSSDVLTGKMDDGVRVFQRGGVDHTAIRVPVRFASSRSPADQRGHPMPPSGQKSAQGPSDEPGRAGDGHVEPRPIGVPRVVGEIGRRHGVPVRQHACDAWPDQPQVGGGAAQPEGWRVLDAVHETGAASFRQKLVGVHPVRERAGDLLVHEPAPGNVPVVLGGPPP